MPIPLMPVLCSWRIGRGKYHDVYFTEVHSLFLTFEWSGGGTMMSISLKSTLCSWHLHRQGEVPWCLFQWSLLSVLDICTGKGRYHVYSSEVCSLFLTFARARGGTMSIPVKSALCSWHLHGQGEVPWCQFQWSLLSVLDICTGKGRYHVYSSEVCSLFLTFARARGGTMSIPVKSALCSWHLHGQGEVPCLFQWSLLSVLDVCTGKGRYHDVYSSEVCSLFLTFAWARGGTMSIPVKSALCSWHLHGQGEVPCLFQWSLLSVLDICTGRGRYHAVCSTEVFVVAVLNSLHGQREVRDVYSTEIHSLFSHQVLPFITVYLDLCLFLNSTLVDFKDHTHSSFSLISINHTNS